MNTEIYIEQHRLDITADISALLTFAIDDIKDFSSRSTTFSKTIVLPGTANNNILFGHIFQPGQSNTFNPVADNVGSNFNAAKSADCIIFQDQIQMFKGVLRLMQINIVKGVIEYEVSVFGNLVGLNVALSGQLLENLDFSAYNHIYNDTNIVNSWNNPGGSGYYYPLIDYGTYSTNKHDWDIKTFRPALYVREYIDKMITGAGYRWQSALFDTPRFKALIVPHNKKNLTIIASQLVGAVITVTQNVTHGSPFTKYLVPWDTVTGTGFLANPAKTIYTYNGTLTANVTLHYNLTGTYTGSQSSNIELFIFKNGTSGQTILHRSLHTTPAIPFAFTGDVTFSVAPGDTIEFDVAGFLQLHLTASDFKITTVTGIPVQMSIGDTVSMNEHIPQNIRQIDFLVGVVKLFNLYVYEDRFDVNLIHITPYIDFYSKNSANSVDWTYKVDRNKVMSIKPMSELNAKIYKFKFKSDSDYYNELYKKRYNEGYGDRTYDTEFEFTQHEKAFEIIFSATPLVGYGSEKKIYPTIFKQTGNAPSVTEENVDSNIRILQTKKITGVPSWNIKNGTTTINTLTRYGYAGHLDDPDIPTNDLNFGATKELFFILTAGNLSNNQFNVYWSGYMREVTDKDSKLLTASFVLTAKDILNLDFSKYVYVDGVAYRLNAIKDYNASQPSDCIVELIKVNLASYSESSSNDGPPTGCYLLWSDEQTLDWDDGEALTYSSCQDNEGDGEPDPPTTKYINWTFTHTAIFGIFRIYVNGDLHVASTSASDSGSFVAVEGDIIKSDVVGMAVKPKHLLITNDVDGVLYDVSTSSLPTLTRTFTVEADKNYNIQGSVSN
jgi:hypothetical protein